MTKATPNQNSTSRKYKARDPVITSHIMASVRSSGSEAEMALRRELSRRGLRYRLHPIHVTGVKIPGKPDLVFVTARVAVFIDGDFWHGRILLKQGLTALQSQFRPKKRDYWIPKIMGNVKRDQETTLALKREGWRVVRVWESEVLKAAVSVAERIERIVLSRTHPGSSLRRCSDG